jgi:mandelate racemase
MEVSKQYCNLISATDTSTADQIILDNILVSTATPELPSPLLTASGQLTNAALVMVKITSKCGVEGHSYLFSPNAKLLPALASAVSVAFEEVKGRGCSPEANTDYLLDKFKLFGGTGILTMAFAAIDMASWDLLGRALGKPLYRLWGGTNTSIPSYESSGLSIGSFSQVLEQAEIFLSNGNSRMKVRLGYETVEEEVTLLSRLKDELGDQIELMVDYNQGLTFDQAVERCNELDDLGLTWIEEPILADMLEQAAKLTAATKTPIQLGENLWSLTEVERALNLGASDYLMPDVAKVGGATQWLRAAKMAEKHGIKVSSHLYPEISAHLMTSISNAHYLEYADWTKLQFSGHRKATHNQVILSSASGVGLYED